MADAFHQATVAHEHVGMVIDDIVLDLAVHAVELLGQQLLGQRHAHRVGDALSQRAGGGLNTRRDADFGVTSGLAVQLAEVLELAHRQFVAGEVQQRIDQHRAMAIGEHETIAVEPLGIGRVVLEVLAP